MIRDCRRPLLLAAVGLQAVRHLLLLLVAAARAHADALYTFSRVASPLFPQLVTMVAAAAVADLLPGAYRPLGLGALLAGVPGAKVASAAAEWLLGPEEFALSPAATMTMVRPGARAPQQGFGSPLGSHFLPRARGDRA
jgi:hypothetical protein